VGDLSWSPTCLKKEMERVYVNRKLEKIIAEAINICKHYNIRKFENIVRIVGKLFFYESKNKIKSDMVG